MCLLLVLCYATATLAIGMYVFASHKGSLVDIYYYSLSAAVERENERERERDSPNRWMIKLPVCYIPVPVSHRFRFCHF